MLVPLGLVALSGVIVLPYVARGAGFFNDDWRYLARERSVGPLRVAGLGKLASRPGAWLVNTVGYGTLGAHIGWWLVALVALNALAAVLLYRTMRVVLPVGTAAAVAVTWVLLPDHTSLRLFPNAAPILMSLIALLAGTLLFDQERWRLSAAAFVLATFCYEATLLPALAVVLVFHRGRGRASPRQAKATALALAAAAAAMTIHPTYAIRANAIGSPEHLLPAHFSGGLTATPALAPILAVVAGLGALVAAVRFWRGERAAGSGPWLVVVGASVVVLGLAAFVLRLPVDARGMADRSYVVSSVGAAIVWVGIGRLVAGVSRPLLMVAAAGFAVVLASTNVTYQGDWSRASHQTLAMLRAVDARYHGHPPAGLLVGPGWPHWAGVPGLNDFYVADASSTVVGHALHFRLAPDERTWQATPVDRRVTWAELIGDLAR